LTLALTEEQTMLARTASAFIAENSPIARIRKLRDTKDPHGYSPELYKQMAELGWTAVAFSEDDGGMGMGLAGLILVTEAMGHGLAPEPILSSVALAGQVLALGGNDAQKKQWLAPLIEGERVLALAHDEAGARASLSHVTTRATKSSKGWSLTGTKTHVIDGHQADAYVVAARSAGNDDDTNGLTLFLVPADAKGLSTVRLERIDTPRNAANVTLKDVALGEDAVIGETDGGHALLAQAIDRGTVALCGEMLGGMQEAFDRTLEYLKERKQFDRVIGSFQGLKHRAARLYMELELSRSATMAAARAIDEGADDAAALVSVAKARCSDAYVQMTNEAVQMHGGIGMTDEHDIGFFMKRARVAEMTFGNAAFHRDRFASVNGY
jgi:alkylation response protein AidB-like acyl-CoA dehydrogenase